MDLKKAAYDYSIRIAEIVRHLRSADNVFPLCDELLKCGVDAGMYLCDPYDPEKAAINLSRADYLLEIAATAGYLTELQTQRIRESGREMMSEIKQS